MHLYCNLYPYLESAKHVIILGAGFGGLVTANLLRKGLPHEKCQITVIDKNQHFIMGIVNLWILSGGIALEDSQVPLNNLGGKGIRFLNDVVTGIYPSESSVTTRTMQNKLEYDYLIVALGAELSPKLIDGFEDYENCFNVYDAHQVPSLRKKILSLKSGRIVICIADIPYKCPPAPYEVSLLVNDMLIKNGTRKSIDLNIYGPTPISLPVAGSNISRDIVNLLNTNHIKYDPLHKLKKVLDKKTIEFENGSKTNYDILIVIPPHQVPNVIKNSGLLEERDQRWINVDRFNLRTKYKNVFAIGDVTEIRLENGVTIPKAGIFAEGEAKVVSQQIIEEFENNDTGNIGKKTHSSKFDGKGFCFMEVGNKKAGYIDVDLYNEEGPIVRLDPPSEELYRKKLDFVKSRLNEWLL